MMKKDAMQDALAKRRGNGIELSILIGQKEDGKSENELNGLAPTVDDKMIEHEEKELGMMKSGTLPPEMIEEEKEEMEEYGPMMEGLGEYDKDRLMKEEPKSLGSRARKMALEGMNKK